MLIRKIEKKDNIAAAQIVRAVMTEYGAVGEGYSIEDPEVDYFYEHYSKEGHAFFVIENEGALQGVAGIAPLKGGEAGVCELQKMYFLPALRGKGMGKVLLGKCIAEAQFMGYQQMYLETLASMVAANGLYKKYGFEAQNNACGSTGHGGCDTYYIRTI